MGRLIYVFLVFFWIFLGVSLEFLVFFDFLRGFFGVSCFF